MKRHQIKRLLFFLFIGVLTSWLTLWLCFKFEVDELIEDVPYNKELKNFFIKRLVKVDPLTFGSCKSGSESDALIYVLGGAQENLKYRLKSAANLYYRGIGKKLSILSKPGITEYDPVIKRNLTNDEWAVRQLVDNGVRKEDIELVSMERGFFGTFAEARGISAIVFRRGCSRLTLVSSPSHTMRVWITFNAFLNDDNITLNISSSDDHTDLKNLLLEYLKLISYKYIIIPIYKMCPARICSG